jgi:integrase
MEAPIRVLFRSRNDREHLLLYYVNPDTGREVCRSAGTADRREAERAAALWEQELLAHRGRDGTQWEHFRRRFEDEHLAALPVKTRKSYATALNAFRKRIKVDLVSSIDAGTVSVFQAELLGEGYPVSTIRTYLTHLRAALNWAKRIGLLRHAPQVTLPKAGKRRMARGRPITEAEYKAMWKLAAPPEKRLLDLLWLSGLRLEEAMRLSWDTPPLYVSLDAKPHPQLVYMIEGHKARRDDATPIPPDFYDWLRKTPAKHRRGLVAPVAGTLSMVSTRISEIGQEAGIEVNETGRRGRAAPHKFASAQDFRRAFGTRWASRVRPLTLKAMMRHESLETTMRFYIGLTGADAGAELWSVRSFNASSE